jgi:hypothetical protein
MSIPSCTPSLVKSTNAKKAKEGLTMGIIQTLAKQHTNATLGTVLSPMHSVVTYEAAISVKEQIRIGTS